MKLTILADNNTLTDIMYVGEPGLSFYIEEGCHKLLFDTGYSDVLMRNAYKMGIDLGNVKHIVLSHGHLDHTWGLGHFMTVMKPLPEELRHERITLIAHPLALSPKIDDGEQIGAICSEAVLNGCFNLKLTRDPLWISEKLVFLGQIERRNSFENRNPIGTTLADGKEQEDYIQDDSALVYKAAEGLVIITGCSHSGICNIVEQAKKVCREERVLDIIGGFHLLNPSKEQLENTLSYMEKLKPVEIHACHCTDLNSRIELSRAANLKETGVGTTLEYV